MDYQLLLAGCIRQTILQNVFDKHEGCYFYAVTYTWQHEDLLEDDSIGIALNATDLERLLSAPYAAIYVPHDASLLMDTAKHVITMSCFSKPIFWHQRLESQSSCEETSS